jgi:hypothetical protein
MTTRIPDLAETDRMPGTKIGIKVRLSLPVNFVPRERIEQSYRARAESQGGGRRWFSVLPYPRILLLPTTTPWL